MKDRVNKSWRNLGALLALSIASTLATPVSSAAAPRASGATEVPRPSYARIADLVIESPAIAHVAVKKLIAIPPERAPGLEPGMQRFLVTAETLSLIRGNDVLAREASFLIDLPGAPGAKPPKWKGRTFIIFGKVEQRVDFFQLLASTALISWSPENEEMVRRVARQFTANDAPPLVEGVDSVFHVPGAIQGEGETQIFLVTGDGSPISLSIVRRPDEQPQFGVSLGEIVDEAAAMPERDTPLWYRLACSLPARLPPSALTGQSSAEGNAAARDYAAFREALGPCVRTPAPLD